MAGYSESDKNKNEYFIFGIHSNATRFKTNFDSIYEKYHKPFLNDDILDLNNMTILKDNGMLKRKEKVMIGAAKLKCGGNKGIVPENQVMDKTFTVDRNVSMAIIRECNSYIGQVEADDDEDAETLSPYSSEEDDDEDDFDDEFDDIDDDDSSLSSLRKNEYESADSSTEDENASLSSPRPSKNSPGRHNSSNESPLKPNVNSTQLLYSNTSITSSLKDLKLVSIASPLKCESLNSSGNSSRLNSSSSSTFVSSIERSIGLLSVNLKQKSFLSPKARDNSIIEKLLSSPRAQQNCQKKIIEESCISNIPTSFKSPTAAVRRRIIPTKIDHIEHKQTTNSFQKSAAQIDCATFSVPNIKEKSVSSSLQKSESSSINSRYSHSLDFYNAFRISPSINSARSSCAQKSDRSSSDSRYSPADYHDSSRVSPSVKSAHGLSVQKSGSTSTNRCSPADLIDSSRITSYGISVNSVRSHQQLEDFTSLLDCNENRRPATTLPRTTESHLKEIASRDDNINSNTFCVDVSFSSSDNDMKFELQNYDFIFQEPMSKQEPSGGLKKTLNRLEKIVPSMSRDLVTYNSETLASPMSYKKSNSKSVQTVDTPVESTSSLLSRSTQTFNSSNNFLESSHSKYCYNSSLVKNKCHLIHCLDHLSQHGFDESKWKNVGKNQDTDPQVHRGLKRKDFSTSDYFTDSSSPRKLRNLMSDHCCCKSHSSAIEMKTLNSQSLEQSYCSLNSRVNSLEKSSRACDHTQQSSALLTRSFQDFNPNFLIKKPIIVDRNKLKKKLAMRMKRNVSPGQSGLCKLKTSSDISDSHSTSIDETNNNDILSDGANRTFENCTKKNFDFSDKQHAHLECVRENSSKIFSKKIPVKSAICHECEISSKNCETFTVLESGISCSTPQLAFRTTAKCTAPEKCKSHFSTASDHASCKHFIIKPDCIMRNKNSPSSLPEMCCYQNKSHRSQSHCNAMFPSSYINMFCPNNPSRIDSDATEQTSNEHSISFESFKEHLKTFGPIKSKVNPPNEPTYPKDTHFHLIPDTVSIPEFDFNQKLSKSRRISSSKLPFKKPFHLKRNRLLKSSNLSGDRAFNPLRASTPFGELSETDSSFSHKTLSTIREPSCSDDSKTDVESTLNQSICSDDSDEVDLLI